jgi:DNA-binding NarL/FixJ family response regulator
MARLLSKKKIMIVDDHPLLRQGIKKVIELESNLTVSVEASSANEAIDFIAKDRPDIVIVDITLAGNISGLDLIKKIRQRYSDIYTIVLTMHDESVYGERSIKAGARGYVMKEVASKTLIHAINTVLDGELFISEKLSKKIINSVVLGNTNHEGMSLENLTDREFEIFHLIGNGSSTREIAGKLNLSIFTVESHKKNIKEKLNIRDSPGLVKYAVQWIIAESKK